MAATKKKRTKKSVDLSGARAAISDTLHLSPKKRAQSPNLKHAEAILADAATNGASEEDLAAHRLALFSAQGRVDEAIATLKIKIKSEHSYMEEAIGIALAVATEGDHRKFLDACLKRIQAKPELLENPITVANVLGELVGKGNNEEAATIAIEHVKRMSSRGMTPVLYTNAILAFASANETGKEATTLAKKIEEKLSARDGAYFKNDGPQKKDLRGSAYAWLALFYARKKDVKAVVKNLEHAARVKYPDLTITELHPALAEVKKDPKVKAIFNRETDTAIAQKTKTITKNPRDWWAVFSRGLIYHERNDLDLAQVDYERTIKLNPRYADVYNNMANLILARGEANSADTENPKASANDFEEAIRWYSKAIDLSKDFFIARMNRAEARLHIGDFKEALVDATNAIRVEPSAPNPHFFAALASAGLKDVRTAKKHASKGLELDGTMSDIDDEKWREKIKALQP
jgi:tetratricopeptide (TPR) repeat protein